MNRHDAEVAKSFLEDQGISSFVAADDVHVPLQLSEGARLHVMSTRSDAALEALTDANMLPTDETGGRRAEDAASGSGESSTGTSSNFYLVIFLLLILALFAAMIWVNVI
jgi:hypothetical protein